jgi:hypothetical protein
VKINVYMILTYPDEISIGVVGIGHAKIAESVVIIAAVIVDIEGHVFNGDASDLNKTC